MPPTFLQLADVAMPSPVTRVCLTPRKPFAAVVSLKSGPPLVVDLSQEQPTVTPLDGIDLKGMHAHVHKAAAGALKGLPSALHFCWG